ncbi:AAA family ATPase [Pseudoalteromonas luteoviolacea]|uniref:AAA+ ATPase domain-containing protein n=1 Tax=Pseudoalteromonas luteoviolacea H33 TaxID=1365251 RepID=A0A167FNU6_9GAMM|nr:MoxR family ATPase [Pseudoalteromonas luteoviolacea]KZN52568.1 hypothetical protein N476_10925 [Pseudoalteromonas luteoviolacea H33]KZN76500.1 hypothetical protein N477_15430 [Pseudoalteromonas luteoviolacea H33-S]MBQ4876996.1 AAA family ATPase [Pseudoalteromonas luteoviolacea]MBQ4905857.1 AAA family ATPase [Pseudoalteromonas luteoviolacea]
MSKLDRKILAQIKSFGQPIRDDIKGWSGVTHFFDTKQVAAIQAAYFANRPLLVRGDPGLGKSQMAPAIASWLNLHFNYASIHANTEIEDLLYKVDHIKRFSHGHGNHDDINIRHFIEPGVVWQAIAPDTHLQECDSKECADTTEERDGSMLLIDEIDKADASLPNALLEVLNNKTISVTPVGQTLEQKSDNPLLVVITSNDEKALPDAFLRRCAILDLSLEQGEEGVNQLLNIVGVHYVDYEKKFAQGIVQRLAEQLIKLRGLCGEKNEYLPGTSELLDILRVLDRYNHHEQPEQLKIIESFFLQKQRQRPHV